MQQEHLRLQQEDAMRMRAFMEQQQQSIHQQQQEIEAQRQWFAQQVTHLNHAAAQQIPLSVEIPSMSPGTPTTSSLPVPLHPDGANGISNDSPTNDGWTLSPSTAEARRANRLALDEL